MEYESGDLAICVTCGTQYDAPVSAPPKSCRICDDPRQYVPPTGQAWTSLNHAKSSQEIHITTDPQDPRLHFLTTAVTSSPHDPLSTSTPASKPLGIGQRAILIQTPAGNILWDCLAYLDSATVDFINSKGGLKAIAISHPHFYTTHLEWARAFACPVYISAADAQWLNREDKHGVRRLFEGQSQEIAELKGSGATVVRCGGHFDGSSVLIWDGTCFHADTFMVVPSAFYHEDRLPGTISYSFLWSYPNMIPLSPDKIHGIWKALKPFEFTATYGGFMNQNNRRKDLKKQLLESMKVFVRTAGHVDAQILGESLD